MARVAHKMSTTRHRNQTPAISQARNPYRKWRCELSRSSHSWQLPNDRLWKLRKVKPSAKENIAISAWLLDRAVAGVAPRLRIFCRLRHASDLCRGNSAVPGKLAPLRPFSAHRAALFARQGALLIAHLAQTLAQRAQVIKRSVIDFGMVTAQDDLMLVIAENAALEFAGYGHGGPSVSCAAANEDWYYNVHSRRINTVASECLVGRSPRWRRELDAAASRISSSNRRSRRRWKRKSRAASEPATVMCPPATCRHPRW